ncbi:hypothetical protein [Halorientalis pallida]|nr:hypothetical protein [Halorientalis pallida]
MLTQVSIDDPAFLGEVEVSPDGTIDLGEHLPEEYRSESVNIALEPAGEA